MPNTSNNRQFSQEQFGGEGQHPPLTQNQQIPIQNKTASVINQDN